MGFLLQVSEANKGMFERERLAGGWVISAFVAGKLRRYGSLCLKESAGGDLCILNNLFRRFSCLLTTSFWYVCIQARSHVHGFTRVCIYVGLRLTQQSLIAPHRIH